MLNVSSRPPINMRCPPMITNTAALSRPRNCENSGTLARVVGSRTSASVRPPTRLIMSPAVCMPLIITVMPMPSTRPTINSAAIITT